MTIAQLPRWVKMFTRKRESFATAVGNVAGTFFLQLFQGE